MATQEEFQVKKGLSTNVPSTVENGSVIFETDTGNMYIDSDGSRQQVKDSTKVSKSGDTMTGDLTIEGNIAATNFRNITDGTTLPSSGNEGDIFLLRNAGSLSIYDMLYPVGSIYMSVNDTDPSLIFGGTWERIQDRFLLAAGSTYTAGATGGEATHTLTESEMPAHTHNLVNTNASGASKNYSIDYNASAKGVESTLKTTRVGGGSAHNNMPPYITVYVWKRLSLSDGSTQIIANGTPIDMTSTPYIVESGTDDFWTYRKWSNGDAECWGYTTSSAVVNEAWGNIYSNPISYSFKKSLPTGLFTSTKTCDYKVECSSNSLFTSSRGANLDATNGTTSDFYVLSPVSISSEISFYVYWNVKGKWK